MKKEYRVLHSQDFDTIIHKGRFSSNESFVLYAFRNKQSEHDHVGISVGKRMGNAVERNKVKRQIRSMIDDIFSFKDGFDYILIVRKTYNHFDYQDNKNKLSVLYQNVYNRNKGELKKETI